MITTFALIQKAAAQIATVQTPHGVVADVGCALESASGHYFYGVCVGVNTGSICAERTAIATMITATREYQIRRIVATWKDADGAVYVIPPCGHCRQFMIDAHPRNVYDTHVILSHDVVVPLAALMPYHDWWQKQPRGDGA